jgi:hypothetical protein
LKRFSAVGFSSNTELKPGVNEKDFTTPSIHGHCLDVRRPEPTQALRALNQSLPFDIGIYQLSTNTGREKFAFGRATRNVKTPAIGK